MFLSTAELRPRISDVFEMGLKRASLPLPLSPPATAHVWYLRMYLSSCGRGGGENNVSTGRVVPECASYQFLQQHHDVLEQQTVQLNARILFRYQQAIMQQFQLGQVQVLEAKETHTNH